MKKLIILIILSIFTNLILAQESKQYYENGNLRSQGQLDNEVPTGKWEYYHENGGLSEVGSFKHGMQTGQWNIFFDTGILKETQHFKDGTLYFTITILEGDIENIKRYIRKEYHPNGELKETGEFDGPNKTGEWKSYYNNGQLNSVHNRETGEYRSFYRNGQLWGIRKFENGIMVGEEKLYYESGTIQSITNYLSSSSEKKHIHLFRGDGEMKHYYQNGQLKQTGHYDAGVRAGIWKDYDESGKLIKTESYIEGVKQE